MSTVIWYLIAGILLAEGCNLTGPLTKFEYMVGVFLWPLVFVYILWKWIF
jgi:hypothetical protein